MTATEINKIKLDAVNDQLEAFRKQRNNLPRNTTSELIVFAKVQVQINQLLLQRYPLYRLL